jgi:signal transduction histidine kinase
MEGENRDQMQTGGADFLTSPMFVAATHELKSPLSLIRQLALGIESGTMTQGELERAARQITLTTERALRLTTNLTKTTRLEDSLFNLEPLNPMTLCEEVVEELTPLYRAKGKQLSITPRVRPLLAIANKDLLRRVLLNFIDNALHYTDKNAPVVVSASVNNGSVRLCVRDYGPELPTKVWEKLMGSLGRTPQPLHSRPESSGLGIHIAHQFAGAMNARVGATRHRDGATFYIDLSASTQLRLF